MGIGAIRLLPLLPPALLVRLEKALPFQRKRLLRKAPGLHSGVTDERMT